MKADKEIAQRLAELNMKASAQRVRFEEDAQAFRKSPLTTVTSLGGDAFKTARAMGLTNLKIALPIARSILLPAALAAGRVALKNGSPRRYIGAALIAALSFGIFKGIEGEERYAKKGSEKIRSDIPQ